MAEVKTQTQKGFDMKYVHYVITALIILAGPYIPPIAPLTAQGMGVLAVFIGVIYGWTFLDMIWPSILGLVGLGIVCGMTTVLTAGFANPIIPMCFLSFALIALLTELHVAEAMAKMLMGNRFIIGKPWLFVFVLFIATMICAQINVFVSMILFTGIVLDLCKQFDIKPYSPFPAVTLLGLALAIQMGQILIPFRSSALTLVAAYSAVTGAMPNFITWMVFIIPLAVLVIAGYTLICRFVFRVDVTPLKAINKDTFEKVILNRDQKIALSFLGLNIFFLLLPSLLPKTWAFTTYLTKLTMFGQVAFVILILMLVKKQDGTKLFNYGAMASKGMSWEGIFITAFILPVSQFLTADGTGVKEMISMALQPMTSLSPYVFIIVVMFFAALVTNFANNMVLAVILLPVVYTFSTQMGLSGYGMSCILFLITQLALFTPGASVFAGLAFSNSDWVKTPTMMKYAVITVLILVVLFLAVAIPFSMIIF